MKKTCLTCKEEYLATRKDQLYCSKKCCNRGWHIDHIRPLASFDLSDPFQFKEACHYTNLQPLWWMDNLIKGDNYVAV
jgi:hypothetical protein